MQNFVAIISSHDSFQQKPLSITFQQEVKNLIEMNPMTHFTNSLWWHNPNLEQDISLEKMIIPLDHNFAHVTTAQLSWHVQICDLTE